MRPPIQCADSGKGVVPPPSPGARSFAGVALAGAGVLLREKRFDLIAEVLGRVAEDAPLRAALLKGQRERRARYERQDLSADLKRLLAPLL